MSKFSNFIASFFGMLTKNNIKLQKDGADISEEDKNKLSETLSNSAALGDGLQSAAFEFMEKSGNNFAQQISELQTNQKETDSQKNSINLALQESAKQIANLNNQLQDLQSKFAKAIDEVAQNNKQIAKSFSQPTLVPLQQTQGAENPNTVFDKVNNKADWAEKYRQ